MQPSERSKLAQESTPSECIEHKCDTADRSSTATHLQQQSNILFVTNQNKTYRQKIRYRPRERDSAKDDLCPVQVID